MPSSLPFTQQWRGTRVASRTLCPCFAAYATSGVLSSASSLGRGVIGEIGMGRGQRVLVCVRVCASASTAPSTSFVNVSRAPFLPHLFGDALRVTLVLTVGVARVG